MPSSPSKYASPAKPHERKMSFDEGGLHIVRSSIEQDCIQEGHSPAQLVTFDYLTKQGFVHARPLCMEVKTTESVTQTFDLMAKSEMSVGTAKTCDIVIADKTKTVAKMHARIYNRHGCTWFQDTGQSEEGSWLILGHSAGGRDEYCLCSGDELTIGKDTGVSLKVLEIHRETRTEYFQKRVVLDRSHARLAHSRRKSAPTVGDLSRLRSKPILRSNESCRWTHGPGTGKGSRSAPQPARVKPSSSVEGPKSARRVLFHEDSEIITSQGEIMTVPTASMGFFVSQIMEKVGEPLVKTWIDRASNPTKAEVLNSDVSQDSELNDFKGRKKSGRHHNIGEGGISGLSRVTAAAVTSRREQAVVVGNNTKEPTNSDSSPTFPGSPSNFSCDSGRSRLSAPERNKKHALKEITTTKELKIVLEIHRPGAEQEDVSNNNVEILEIEPQNSHVTIGKSGSCNVVIPETVPGTILPEHFSIDYQHGSFYVNVAKLAGLGEIDLIDDESNIDDPSANRRARVREQELMQIEKKLASLYVKISSSSHGEEITTASAFTEICIHDRLLLGHVEAEIVSPRIAGVRHPWRAAALQISVGGHIGGDQVGTGVDAADSVQKVKHEEIFSIVDSGLEEPSLVVGRKSETCDLTLHNLEHKELAQVGGEHVRIYRRKYDRRFYCHTMPAGRHSGLFLLLGRGMVGGNRGHQLTPGDIFRLGSSQFKVVACKAKGRGVKYGDSRQYGLNQNTEHASADITKEKDIAKPSFTSHYQLESRSLDSEDGAKSFSPGQQLSISEGKTSPILSENEIRWGPKPMDNPDFLFLPHFIILEAMSGPLNGRTFPLNERRITIGTSTGATITVNDRTLESFHSYIELGSDGRYVLHDLETDAGTFLRIDNVGGDVLLDFGDVLSLGTSHTEIVVWGELEKPTKKSGIMYDGCCTVS